MLDVMLRSDSNKGGGRGIDEVLEIMLRPEQRVGDGQNNEFLVGFA